MINRQIWRQDKEGWSYGITECGDIFVGSIHDFAGKETWYMKDTPENRAMAESYWEANSFAREIKNGRYIT